MHRLAGFRFNSYIPRTQQLALVIENKDFSRTTSASGNNFACTVETECVHRCFCAARLNFEQTSLNVRRLFVYSSQILVTGLGGYSGIGATTDDVTVMRAGLSLLIRRKSL